MAPSGRTHPRCINSSNPYHQCSDYCYKKIAERDDAWAPPPAPTEEAEVVAATSLPTSFGRQRRKAHFGRPEDVVVSAPAPKKVEVEEPQLPVKTHEPEPPRNSEEEEEEEDLGVDPMANMDDRQKKLFELRLKLNQARKMNQSAVVAEKQRENAPAEPRGMSRQKWFEDRQKKVGKQLEANGLDMKQAYMLETQEDAETKYKKWEKKPAPFGWDVFNQKSLYKAYDKRTKDIPYTLEDYEKMKAKDPDFYRDATSLQYGQAPAISSDNMDVMVAELEYRAHKKKQFSRRRKFYDEKDVDHINDRNAHFNRKIERAFGKYTTEIKNNLERGTALPD